MVPVHDRVCRVPGFLALWARGRGWIAVDPGGFVECFWQIVPDVRGSDGSGTIVSLICLILPSY